MTRPAQLLRSGRIAGLREHRGKATEAVWPGIIGLDDHRRIRAVLDDGAATRAGGHGGRLGATC